MVVPIPPLPREELGLNDIDIVACQRNVDGASPTERRTFGVRWGARPDLGWPSNPWVLERIVNAAEAQVVEQYHLPRSDNWTSFSDDARQRRPRAGPYFEPWDITEENLGFLMPIVRLADPRVSAKEGEALTREVAEFFGNPHEGDAQLTIELWGRGDVPPLDVLLANATVSVRIINWYRAHCTGFLFALALRFEYAVLLGLATDDYVHADAQHVVYRITGRWQGAQGVTQSDPIKTNLVCAPSAPDQFDARRAPGSVGHRAFNAFGAWIAPNEILPLDSNGTRERAEALVPRVPAHITALEWSAPPPSNRLLTYEPVLYLLQRFDHGAATAADVHPPPDPQPDAYRPIFDGELLMQPEAPPHALDRPGMPWPAMEGHYHYQLQGITLLGVATAPVVTSIRHFDDLPPAAPGVRLIDEQAAAFADAMATTQLRLGIVWNAAHDFAGPDVTEFRVSTRWVPREAIPVRVQQVVADTDSEYTATVTIASLQAAANQYAGVRLVLPDGEFPIVSHGAGAQVAMRVRRVGGRMPAPNRDGVIFAAGSPIAAERIARVPRRPSVPAFVDSVESNEPLRIKLRAAATEAIPAGENFSIYVHLMRTSFTAISEANGVWRIDVPPAGDPRADAWTQWLALSDPAALLTGSPVIVFPEHVTTLTIRRPERFNAGLLLIDVTAADGAFYVASPAIPAADAALTNLTGNESEPGTATLSARLLTPPPAPRVPRFDPLHYLWAKSAAVYAEEAYYDLSWPAIGGAAYYEVSRVLEGALRGAKPSTPSPELRALAVAQPDKFALRSGKVFGPRYRDALPGRAPTRAFYRIRAIDVGGNASAWSDLLGTVYVPDVRPPSAPNLTAATVPRDGDRRVVIEWTQSGPLDDLRFDIEMQDRDAETWSVVALRPRGTPPTPGTERSYHHEIADLIPGEKRRFRVRAVREARDPVDLYGQMRRDVAGPPSEVREGHALGTLVAPESPAAEAIISGDSRSIRLSWLNRDRYVKIEVLRKGPQEHRFIRTATLAGDLEEFVDAELTSGDWSYTLRALGYSRKAETGEIGATLP